MNLDNSEEGQLIGMEDDIVKIEDLGRRSLMGRKRNHKRKMKGRKRKEKKGKRKEKKGKRKEKKGKRKERKRKTKKGKGCRKGKPMSWSQIKNSQGPTCCTNKDCGPYGLCNGGHWKKAVFVKTCSCYGTKEKRNRISKFRTGPLSLDQSDRCS